MFVASVECMRQHTTNLTNQSPDTWELTLLSKQGEPTVVTTLSRDQARLAISALVTGDDKVIEHLTAETFPESSQRAA
jgi:hypothetical protein